MNQVGKKSLCKNTMKRNKSCVKENEVKLNKFVKKKKYSVNEINNLINGV